MNERRQYPRHHVEIPVSVHGVRGVTRDVSINGIAFKTALDLNPGTPVELTLHFSPPGGAQYRVECVGTVVRRDAGGYVAASVQNVELQAIGSETGGRPPSIY